MKYIHLTQGFVTFVDDEDYDWLNKYSWYVNKSDKTNYAGTGHIIEPMHIKILTYYDLWVPGLQTDHIDRDGLNNQKYNLRVVTQSVNCLNRTMRSDNTSGYKGVSPYKGMWRVTVNIDKKKIYLGDYVDKHHAARIYNQFAILYLGPHCFLNDVPDDI